MQTRTFTLTFTGAGSQRLPGGVFFFIATATAALDLALTEQNGTTSQMLGVGAGARLRRPNEPAWRYTDITSASAQVVKIIISEDAEFDVANTVTVSGSVTVQDVPATAMADTADTALAAAATSVIPANASRRKIVIGVPSSALNSVRVSTAGTAGRGIEIQPGQFAPFDTTAALTVRNDDTFGTAAATSFYAEEFT
jgi:hypothetical protein